MGSVDALTRATTTLTATVEKLIDTSTTERTKEKGLKALPEETKRALEHMSSYETSDGSVVSSITPYLKEFFEWTSAASANISLEAFVTQKTNTTASLQSLATSVYCGGGVAYTDPMTPSGITIFSCAETSATLASSLSQSVPYILAVQQGQVFSEEQVKRLTKLRLVVPLTYDEALRQVMNFEAVLLFFFGPRSPVTLMVAEWKQHMEDHRPMYRKLQGREFFLALFQEIDSGVQAYWRQCLTAKSWHDLNGSLLDGDSERNKIEKGRSPFSAPQPLNLQEGGGGAADNEDEVAELRRLLAEERSKKKRKPQQQERRAQVALNDDTRDFGITSSGGSFRSKYGSDSPHYEDRPKVNGVPFCTPFHLKKKCGRGRTCPFAASHRTPASAEATAVEQYVVLCNQ